VELIAGQQGGDAETSHYHDGTDWEDLTRFVEEVLGAITLQKGGHPAAMPAAGLNHSRSTGRSRRRP
jgi:hypothetical protein